MTFQQIRLLVLKIMAMKWLLQDFVASQLVGWKQPLGYALVNAACWRDEMEMLMRSNEKLLGIGLTVVIVISDMGSNF